MKRPSGKARKRRNAVQVWTHSQALAIVPYVKSIMATLREQQLKSQQSHLTARRLAERPGRPSREVLIAQAEARREADQADAAFDDAAAELEALDIYSLDPVGGVALVPTVHEDQLAWFVYDHFDAEPLRFWRYHTDPLDMRRPLSELQTAPTESSWTA